MFAVVIAFSWVWGAATTLQKNYQYQQKVDELAQQIELTKLRNQNLAYEQDYLQSEEYVELKVRQYLGKGLPGEKLVILPSSDTVVDAAEPEVAQAVVLEQTNFDRWMQFFFSKPNSST